mmetsp:Transcript_33130/g.70493  ORF Transcript_33130/g.70493 Transcript_33130/m.70493 type:complete len:219 (+) Transcript_33130:97-753(+)
MDRISAASRGHRERRKCAAASCSPRHHDGTSSHCWHLASGGDFGPEKRPKRLFQREPGSPSCGARAVPLGSGPLGPRCAGRPRRLSGSSLGRDARVQQRPTPGGAKHRGAAPGACSAARCGLPPPRGAPACGAALAGPQRPRGTNCRCRHTGKPRASARSEAPERLLAERQAWQHCWRNRGWRAHLVAAALSHSVPAPGGLPGDGGDGAPRGNVAWSH